MHLFLLRINGKLYWGYRGISPILRSGLSASLYSTCICGPDIVGEVVNLERSPDHLMVLGYTLSDTERLSVFDTACSNELSEIIWPQVHYAPTDERGWPQHEERRNLGLTFSRLDNDEIFFRESAVSVIGEYGVAKGVAYDPACSTGSALAHIQAAFPNIIARGSDIDKSMLAVALSKGLAVIQEDAWDFARSSSLVDVLFLRFLNSEVLPREDALRLFHAIVSRVNVGGLILVWGHTATHAIVERVSTNALRLMRCSSSNYAKTVMFPFYVWKVVSE